MQRQASRGQLEIEPSLAQKPSSENVATGNIGCLPHFGRIAQGVWLLVVQHATKQYGHKVEPRSGRPLLSLPVFCFFFFWADQLQWKFEPA